VGARALSLLGKKRSRLVSALHATRILHSRRLSVSRMRENLTYGLMRGRWKRTVGLLDRDTRPKGEKRPGVAGPQTIPRHCSTLQLRNLLAKAPAHLREELAEDYRRMVYAETREAVEHARVGFLRKWRLRCKAVVSSLEEAGDELFTFLQFPTLQWKALRTTNALERINEEFRRRTKTQASLPGEDAVLLLLYGLLRSGQIVLRRIDGRNDLPKPKPQLKAA
jgi:Transposase, Mutator family